jgi:hypothetical protein
MEVIGKKWDEYNETEVNDWDEGAEEAYRLWPTEGSWLALIDADMIPYIVGFSQSEDKWNKALKSVSSMGLKPNSNKWFKALLRMPYCDSAIDHANLTINLWVRGADCDSAKLYLTEGKDNFRYNVAFSRLYKGTASRNKSKPPFFSLIKWYLVKYHNAIVATTEEADDLMAIEQYQRNEELALDGAKQGSDLAKKLSRTVIVTKDKDLRMIPGWHSNPDVEYGKKEWVTRFGELLPRYVTGTKSMKDLKGTGLSFFYAQILTGDTVDNYTGLVGMGCSRAYDLLVGCRTIREMEEAVINAYADKYGTDKFQTKSWTGRRITVDYMDMFVQQARLAWMQTFKGEVYMKEHKLPSPKKWGKPKED